MKIFKTGSGMTIQEILDMSIEMGIKHGPRPRKDIEEKLKQNRADYQKLSKEQKEYYDIEQLTNPFLDTRILYGDPRRKVKRVLVGIDISISGLLLAKELGRMGKEIDLVIAHHPSGRALVDLDKVMDLQHDVSLDCGVPINVVEKVMESRLGQVARSIHTNNNYQVPDAARLLEMPLMALHTVADNQCYNYFRNYIEPRKPKYLEDVVNLLNELPEFKEARKIGMEPKITLGGPRSRVGKISYFGLTGGTNGSKDIYKHLAQAGVGTLVDMHLPEDHREEAAKYHLNVVVATHMVSDSLGMNLLLDEMEKKGVEILSCGGMIRCSRVKAGNVSKKGGKQ